MSQRLVINKMEGAKRKRKIGASLNNVIFHRVTARGTGGEEEDREGNRWSGRDGRGIRGHGCVI